MSSPAPSLTTLASVLAAQGIDSISLRDLMQYCAKNNLDHRQTVGGSVAARASWWRRIKGTQHDPERVVLMLSSPPNPAPGPIAGQLSIDVSGDPEDVSDYMSKILSALAPGPNVPQDVAEFADETYAHYEEEEAQGGSTKDLCYKIDELGRTISVSGLISVHPQRPKGAAPTPHAGSKKKKKGDHKGHLFAAAAAEFAKSADAFPNVIWEMSQINLSFKKRFENSAIAFAADNPNCMVTTVHVPHYRLGEFRPYQVDHYMVVDGVVVGVVKLDNE